MRLPIRSGIRINGVTTPRDRNRGDAIGNALQAATHLKNGARSRKLASQSIAANGA